MSCALYVRLWHTTVHTLLLMLVAAVRSPFSYDYYYTLCYVRYVLSLLHFFVVHLP